MKIFLYVNIYLTIKQICLNYGVQSIFKVILKVSSNRYVIW